jgi:predicted permease
MNTHDLFLRIRALLVRPRVEREMHDEIGFHLEMETRKHLAAGMTRADAVREARIQFGGVARVQEECRDARRVNLLESIWHDFRYALRAFARAPGFVATVAATIALGLGINTAVFTVFDATYLRPIAVADPAALYECFWTDRSGAAHDFTWNEYQNFLTANPGFSAALAYQHTQARHDGRNMLGTLVTANYFEVLGVKAIRGRTLLAEDTSPGLVLSHRAWQITFRGDPEIVGKKLVLRGVSFEIIGVAAEGFTGLGSRPSEFWAPLALAARLNEAENPFTLASLRTVSIVARLRTDTPPRQAESRLTAWTQRLTSDLPGPERALQATLFSRATTKTLSVRNTLAFAPVLIAFSVVLLIGCGNVANMLLARSITRQREMGIRLSLGATRGRLIRQLVTESLVLAVPSAVAGFVLSQAILALAARVLVTAVPAGVADFLARMPDLSPDPRVFGFTFLCAFAAAAIFGIAPAWQAARVDVAAAANGASRGDPRPASVRGKLLIGQVATCVLLFGMAGLLLRGADRTRREEAALSTRDTLQIVTNDKARDAVVQRLLGDPGVQMLAAASSAPVDRKTAARVIASGGTVLPAAINLVSPEYFAMFELPILAGRNFAPGEARGKAPVAIVSQSFAHRVWPNRDALGQSLRVVESQQVNVIGVVRDEISRSLGTGEDNALIYLPAAGTFAGMKLFAAVHGDIETARRRIEPELATVAPDAIEDLRRFQVREWIDDDLLLTMRLAYWLSYGVGVLALLLTFSGVYGVVSCLISQRTKEIGIRMALGATRAAVTGLIVAQSMRLAGWGAAAGLLVVLGVARVLAAIFATVDALDWIALAGGFAIVMLACAAGAYIPSRRAARIDPFVTLRND